MGISMSQARETDEKWGSIWIEFAKKQGSIKKALAIVVVFPVNEGQATGFRVVPNRQTTLTTEYCEASKKPLRGVWGTGGLIP